MARSYIAAPGVYVDETGVNSYIVAPGVYANETDTPTGWSSFFDSVKVTSSVIPNQRFDSFQPFPQTVAAIPQGWESTPSFLYSTTVSGLDYLDSPAPPVPPIIFEANYDKTKILPFNASKQRYDSFQTPGVITSAIAVATPGWSDYFDKTRIYFPTHRQQYDTFQPFGNLAAGGVGWEQGWPSVVSFSSPNLQQFDSFQSLGNIATIAVPQGWSFYYNYGKKPPTAALQQYGTYQPFGNVSTPATPQGWTCPYDSTKIRAFPLNQQQYDVYQSFIVPPLPPPVTEIHNFPFIANVGIMMQRW